MTYDFKQVKVMVVESSVPMFKLVKSVLNVFGVPEQNLFSAYTAEEAFEKFCQHGHDLVIADWLRNPDHVIHLAKMIRTHKETPNAYVPIVMTAGSGHLTRVLHARDAGISEYLVKPFSAKSLADRITRVIELPRLFVVSNDFTGPDRRVQKNETIPYRGSERRKERSKVIPVTS